MVLGQGGDHTLQLVQVRCALLACHARRMHGLRMPASSASQTHTTSHHHQMPSAHAPRCRACSFCTPTDQLTHVYASAGAGMAACAEGARLPWPSSGAPGSPTGASLDQCKAACDEAALRASTPLTACRAFLYSGTRRECRLSAAGGEPRKFCNLNDFASYWRVELPASAAAAAAAAGGGDVALVASAAAAAPSRIVVQGRRLLDSRTGEEVTALLL